MFYEYFEAAAELRVLKDIAEAVRFYEDTMPASFWNRIEELEAFIASAPIKVRV